MPGYKYTMPDYGYTIQATGIRYRVTGIRYWATGIRFKFIVYPYPWGTEDLRLWSAGKRVYSYTMPSRKHREIRA